MYWKSVGRSGENRKSRTRTKNPIVFGEAAGFPEWNDRAADFVGWGIAKKNQGSFDEACEVIVEVARRLEEGL